jgi:Fe2+ transport system protein FeoA
LSRQSQEIQKLVAIGILPGTSIHLIQKYPSYVFDVGNTQYAVDKNIASEIYVRVENQNYIEVPQKKAQKQHRNFWGLRQS